MGVRHSTLHEVVHQQPPAVRRHLAKYKHDINAKHNNKTALFIAVCLSSAEVVDLLLEHEADPNVECMIQRQDGCEFQWSTMHEACRLGREDLLTSLIKNQGDVNLHGHHQLSPLHIAAWHSHKTLVLQLVNAGCDVNQLDRFKESAIVIPICHGDRSLVEILLNAGCKLNSRSWGNTRKIRGKHEQDFRCTLYDRQGPYSLFLLSIKYSWLDISMLLLIHGFNPNKYQAFVILKALKSSLGEVGKEQARLLHCFVSSGYRFKEQDERLLGDLLEHEEHGYDANIVRHFMRRSATPHTLKQLSRIAIRSQLRLATEHQSILGRISKLELPTSLVDYLTLRRYQEFLNHQQEVPLEASSLEPLYFAMPRKAKRRNFYRQFWMTTCCSAR